MNFLGKIFTNQGLILSPFEPQKPLRCSLSLNSGNALDFRFYGNAHLLDSKYGNGGSWKLGGLGLSPWQDGQCFLRPFQDGGYLQVRAWEVFTLPLNYNSKCRHLRFRLGLGLGLGLRLGLRLALIPTPTLTVIVTWILGEGTCWIVI